MPCQQRKTCSDAPSLMTRCVITATKPQKNPLHALWLCNGLDIVCATSELWDFRRTTMFLDFRELLSWIIMQGKMPSFSPSHASQSGHSRIKSISTNRPLLFIRYLNYQRNDLQNLYQVRSLQLPRYGLQLVPGAVGNLHLHQSL